MSGKRSSENKARRNGFYIALAVCLAAVGIAAWSTWDAVQTYNGAVNNSASSPREESSKPVGRDTASRTESKLKDTDPEAPVSSAPARPDNKVTSEPAETAPERPPSVQTAARPAPVSGAPAEAEPEAAVPATAPIYEITNEMTAPVRDGTISTAYSSGAPVYSQTMRDWRIHIGADYPCAVGENIRACANGQVKETYADDMLGGVIVVEHGDYVFRYCGVDGDFTVAPGDVVTKGQNIAVLADVPGETADGPHLHLEVRRDGVCLDPGELIK